MKHEGYEIYQIYGVWILAETYSPSKFINGPTGHRILGGLSLQSTNDEEVLSRYSPIFSSHRVVGTVMPSV